MTVPTRIVTSHFDTSTGTPVANQQFSFRRVPWSHRAGSVVLSDTIPATTDAAGDASTVLWTNAEGMRPSRYTVLYPNGEQSKAFVLPAGTTPISLDELFALQIDFGVPDIDDLLDARDESIYGAFGATADVALGDALVGATLTNDGIQRTVHDVLDEFDDQMDTHEATISDADTPGHVDLTTIQSMIDVTHSSISLSSTWVWKATVQSGDPGTNSAGANNDDAASATILYLNRSGAGGTDYGGLIASLRSGDAIYIQQVNDANRWHRLQVTGSATVTGSAYAIPITHLGDGSGGEPANNAALFVSFSPSVSGSGIPPVGGEVPDNSVSSIKIVDGSIVAGDLAVNSVTTAKIVDNAVTTAKILDANVTAAKLAAAAVTAAKIDPAAITQPNLVADPYNLSTDPRYDWGDTFHWHQGQALTMVVDATNPFSSKTLRYLGSAASSNAGRKVPFSECGLQVGDTFTPSIMAYGTSGTYGMSIAFYSAADALVGSSTNGPNQTYTVPGVKTFVLSAPVTVPATAAAFAIYMRRVGGSADLDIYAMWANKGSYAGTMPNPGTPDSYLRRGDNLMWDPFFRTTDPRQNFGSFSSWHEPTALQIVEGVAGNPFGGRTLRFLGASASSVTGKRIPLKDVGIQVDDTLSFAALVQSAGTGSWSLRCVFQDATNTNIGSTFNGATTGIVANVTRLRTPAATVPAGAVSVLVYLSRPSGTADLDIYAMWGAKNGTITATPAPSALPLNVYQDVAEVRPLAAETGLCYLQDWRGIIGKIQNAVAGSQAVIALLGDSWVERKNISTNLRQSLQTLYGDAGPGWIDFFSANASGLYDDGWTFGRAGTWTNTDSGPTAKGVSLTHMVSTDIATPGWIALASTGSINEIRIHSYAQPGGGSFRWRVDGGAWTTVSTDGVAGLLITTIAGLSTALHSLDIEVTVAGSQGVTLMGADLRKTGLGVRVHKAGNGSTQASDWIAPDATIWQAGITALAPNVGVILLGTNDKSLNVVPAAYATSLTTLISRYRTAAPLSDLLLLSPADTGDIKPFATQSYDAAMRATATAQSTTFVSGYMHLGLNANAIARGLMDPLATGNSRHLTDDGGRVFANLLLHALRVN